MTKMYEAKNHILIHTDGIQPEEHKHGAAHIMVSIDGTMRVASRNVEYVCRGIVIPSGIYHEVDTFGKNVLVFLYDSTTTVSKQIKEIRSISEECCEAIVEVYLAFEQRCNAEDYYGFENDVLAHLGFETSISSEIDERIVSVMKYIRSRITEEISSEECAKNAHLSQSRFSHLFKEQVGMTFAAYVVYQRILYVYYEIFHGRSITEAALEAGFSSSSHFADVNRRVFGISASGIIKDLEFIKAG